ncbi:MAG: TonB-dependent receptor [Sphingomonas sp.]|uniref:TonB-dependent receptor n=1 Tax=Sphingomonas sp. TaxID=28214 RepID=UPI003563D264
MIPGAAFAQSTGSTEFGDTEGDIVVTAQTANGVGGIVVPDAPKARAVLTNEILMRESPGNTVLDSLNIIPGVNFTQSDAFGSSGGNIRIRGFDGNRISLTFDGFPLNDTGNYAIYSNQQLDPELIDEVNVNLGTTDIDSPTASAAGGTINYRTIVPSDDFSATLAGSMGDYDYMRIFGMVQPGTLTSFGTKVFVAASMARNDKFKGPGRIEKQQYNVGLYQPIGSNGDFFRISGHFNKNRNAFYRNPSITDLRNLLGATQIPANATATAANPINIGDLSKAQQDTVMAFENDATCARPVPGPGAQSDSAGAAAACSNYYGVRINPSNTGNVRFNSRFTLTDKLLLTADASYQYTLANGGGSTTLAESSARARGGSTTALGVDYNGDGDIADTVRFYTPNNTNTNRITATSSLIYNIDDQNRVRVAYTYDRGNHRQTGEWGFLDPWGNPESPFGGRKDARPVLTADGYAIQQRNRLSIALLNQISGEYVGKFMDEALTVQIGVRAPFFKRDLDQRCYTEARGSGFAYCTSEIIPAAGTPNAAFVIIAPNAQVPLTPTNPVPLYAPFKTKYSYSAVLPSAGLVYKFGGDFNIFASYAKGFSAPRTDNLYRSPFIGVKPEKTDAFDLGIRMTNNKVQAQATAWYIAYQNRIVTSFDQEQGISIDRNVGKVKSYGVDASVTVKATDWVSLTGMASYIHAELQDNIALTTTTVALTKGKMVAETPEWQVGGRAQFKVGPVDFGAEAKWVDKRFATDVNDVVVPAYTLVDLDARFNLRQFGLDKAYFQMNVKNLFNEFYYGNISTQINVGGGPNFSVGYPRTVLGTVHFEI